MRLLRLLDYINTHEDAWFDLIYPPEIRELSDVHWTPVNIARLAAEFLVSTPGTRVLDIGCGPGKFCMVGALTTSGHFTGVEQRKNLSDLAQKTIVELRLQNVEIRCGNIEYVDFSRFEAFYLFNPFEENLSEWMKIDGTIPIASVLYKRYTEHVARQLAKAPIGTRVATYCGECDEVPLGYERLSHGYDSDLKFWKKAKTDSVQEDLSTAASVVNSSPLMQNAIQASAETP